MEFRRVLFRSSLQRDLCFEMSQNTGAILIARAPLAPPWVLSFAFHDLYLPQDRSSVTSFYRIGKPPPPAAESREGTLCRLSADRTRQIESVCPPLAAVFRSPSRSDERRVGQGCVCTCRSRWSRYNSKNNNLTTNNTK